MAPSVIAIDPYPLSSTTTPAAASQKSKVTNLSPGTVVDLPLTLNTSHIVEAARSHYAEYLDEKLAHSLDIEAVLNICWLLVVHCFSPSRVMYLEFHPGSNFCYISDTFEQGAKSYGLEFAPDRQLRDLVRDFCRIKAGLTSPHAGNDLAPDTQGRFLSSAIRYAGDQSSLQEAPQVVNSTVSLVRFLTPRSEVKLTMSISRSPTQNCYST